MVNRRFVLAAKAQVPVIVGLQCLQRQPLVGAR